MRHTSLIGTGQLSVLQADVRASAPVGETRERLIQLAGLGSTPHEHAHFRRAIRTEVFNAWQRDTRIRPRP